jgi:Mrp family chromosome partitioning ATPase
MVDLSAEMTDLWTSLGVSPGRRGRAIQFVGATNGQGASTVAREFAFHAATRASRRVWLIDLDLLESTQADTMAREAKRFGALGSPATASPDGSAFFTVQPPLRRPDGRPWPDARYLSAHSVGGSPLWVTRFRHEALRPRQAVHIVPSGDYWNALKRHADLIVVDAPPADRSEAALTVAKFMDDTVLVVAADQPDVGAPARLRDAITAAGGRCAGLFLNRAEIDAPRFLKSAR